MINWSGKPSRVGVSLQYLQQGLRRAGVRAWGHVLLDPVRPWGSGAGPEDAIALSALSSCPGLLESRHSPSSRSEGFPALQGPPRSLPGSARDHFQGRFERELHMRIVSRCARPEQPPHWGGPPCRPVLLPFRVRE